MIIRKLFDNYREIWGRGSLSLMVTLTKYDPDRFMIKCTAKTEILNGEKNVIEGTYTYELYDDGELVFTRTELGRNRILKTDYTCY